MKNLSKKKNTLTNPLEDKKGRPEYLSLKYPRKVDKSCLVRHSIKITVIGQRLVLNF